jgi:uroporphyrinogen-III decarboxylase
MTPKERIYATLKGESYDHPAVTPIFMAWSANFIGHTYRDYYLDGDVLVKAQLAVTRTFNIDQISAISDPWREASAYGMEFDYPPDGVGKPNDVLIKTAEDISLVKPFDIVSAERPKQRIESVRKLAADVGQTHSVLGWVEGPIAEYGDLRGIESTMMDLIDKPEMFVRAGEVIIENAISFAVGQIEAGADMIGVGDAAASLITPNMYVELVLPLEKKLINAIHEAGGTVKLHISSCRKAAPTSSTSTRWSLLHGPQSWSGPTSHCAAISTRQALSSREVRKMSPKKPGSVSGR